MGFLKKKKKEEIVDQTEQAMPQPPEPPNLEKKKQEHSLPETEEPPKTQYVEVYPYAQEMQTMIELLQRMNEHLEESKVLLRRGIELSEEDE